MTGSTAFTDPGMSGETEDEPQRNRDLPATRLSPYDENESPNSSIVLVNIQESVVNMSYVYDVLPLPTAIRVLRLQPGEPDEPLKGSLELVDLKAESFPGYWALSYVWGDPTPHGTIDMGYDLPIARNLDEALRQFRLRYRETVLWVDAVCIDQANTSERCHQVGLMREIYSEAKEVIAWLGPDPSKRAQGCFDILRKKRDLKCTQSVAAALSELVTSEWFSRLWVVQELILARDAVFVWGDQSISAKIVQLNARGWNRGAPRYEAIWIGELRPYVREFELLEVLTWTRGLRCSDDRDRVYALLGLTYSEDPQIASTIVPDYQTTTTCLYVDLMSKFVRAGFLTRLWSHHWSHENSELPSWVIDWRVLPSAFGTTQRRKVEEGCAEPIPGPRVVPKVLGQELTIHGVLLATVKEIAPQSAPPHDAFWSSVGVVLNQVDRRFDVEEQSFWQQLEEIAIFWKACIRPPWPSCDHPEVLSNTLAFADMLFSQRPTFNDSDNSHYETQMTVDRYKKMMSLILDTGRTAAALHDMMKVLAAHPSIGKPNWHISWEFPPKFEDLTDFWRSLRVFVSDAGYGGLGPHYMRPGDVVTVLSGCKYPVLLRPGMDCYYYVGQAYSSAIDESKIKKVWSSEEEQLQEFVLR
jgi:hypothetical protein